jgi:hypothetical protein
MKGLLLLATLLLPAAATAQGAGQSKAAAPQFKATTVEQALQGSANMHGFKLATGSFLYRNLADTTGNRYAHRVRPGDHVIIQTIQPHWYVVYRAKDATQFSDDMTPYYMPKSAAAGALVFVLL